MLLVLEQLQEGHDGSCAVLRKYEGSYDRKDDKEGVWLNLVCSVLRILVLKRQ